MQIESCGEKMHKIAKERESLLGDKACEDLGLVRRVYYINLDVPVIHAAKRVPAPLKDKARYPCG